MYKPIFYFALTVLCLGASYCAAQSGPVEICPPKRSLLCLETGFGFTLVNSRIPLPTSSGPDLGLEGYYLLDRHWAWGFSLTFGWMSQNEESFDDAEIMMNVRYRLESHKAGPYLMTGVGELYQTYTVTHTFNNMNEYFSAYGSDPVWMIGGGWEFEIGHYTNLFLQGQVHVALDDAPTSYFIPLEAGINFGL
jgi:hypothetical protein